MQGATVFSPVAASQGVVPYQGALPVTWAYQNETDMTGIITAIMPIIVLMMLMMMIVPMVKGMAAGVK